MPLFDRFHKYSRFHLELVMFAFVFALQNYLNLVVLLIYAVTGISAVSNIAPLLKDLSVAGLIIASACCAPLKFRTFKFSDHANLIVVFVFSVVVLSAISKADIS